jgi:hypothetical protein
MAARGGITFHSEMVSEYRSSHPAKSKIQLGDTTQTVQSFVWAKTLRVQIVTHQNHQKKLDRSHIKFHDKITTSMICPAIGDMA